MLQVAAATPTDFSSLLDYIGGFLGLGFEYASDNAETAINALIGRAVDWAAIIAGVVLLGIFLYGGFQYLISSGDPGKTEQAQKILINGAIGFAIVILAYSITILIASLFGIPVGFGIISGGSGGGGTITYSCPTGGISQDDANRICQGYGKTRCDMSSGTCQ